MKKVSVILNCFRRPHTLKDQYSAVLSQSIKPHEILIWKNDPGANIPFNFSSINAVVSHNNTNFGVWARFSFALNSTGDYICVLDDDTIPGPNWFANCIECIENEHNGLYGTIGVIFNDLEYRSYERVGWAAPNGETRKVDIVGHSWFFHRDLLSAFWRETAPPLSHLCGEDMHFSYSIQKYLNLCTYVPPHPQGDTSLWGSDPDSAQRLGVDQHAISINHHSELFGDSLKHYYNKGFNLQRI